MPINVSNLLPCVWNHTVPDFGAVHLSHFVLRTDESGSPDWVVAR